MNEKEEKNDGKLRKLMIMLKEKFGNKKVVQLLVCAILGLVVVSIFLSSTTSISKAKKTEAVDSSQARQNASVLSYSQELEHKLESVLGTVKNCQNVKVVVVCESTPIVTIAEQTEIKTTSSGENQTISKYPVYEENGSTKTPMILFESAPKITGVLVVAKGAGETATRLKLIAAIQTLLGIDSSKIDVLEGE